MPAYQLNLGSPEHATAFRALPGFAQGYIMCALWTEEERLADEGCDSLNDIAPAALAAMVADCAAFEEDNAADIEAVADTFGLRPRTHLGHDFWLSRNGHGTGFWDRGLGAIGERLHTAAQRCGTRELYVGDDGLVHA